MQFPDSSISDYAANIIAEAIYGQVKEEGHENILFFCIIGQEFNPTELYNTNELAPEVHLSQVDLISGLNPSHTRNIKGWKICVEWSDGTSSWHSMSEIKNVRRNELLLMFNLHMQGEHKNSVYKHRIVLKKLWQSIKQQIQPFGMLRCKRSVKMPKWLNSS